MNRKGKVETPTPANDPDNVVRFVDLCRARNERRRRADASGGFIPPDRALMLALLSSMATSSRQSDQRRIASISWELTGWSRLLGEPDGFQQAIRMFELATGKRP